MVKIKKQFNDSAVTLIELLRPESLEALNSVFGTHYKKVEVKQTIRIERASQEPEFWDKMMKEKPGFDRGDS